MGTCHVVVKYYGTPNPEFYFDMLFFTWPQKILPVTLKSAPQKKFYLTFLKVSPKTKFFPYFIFLLFFKVKTVSYFEKVNS